jgi:hypothetical protein
VRADDGARIPATGLSSIRFLKTDTATHSPFHASENILLGSEIIEIVEFPSHDEGAQAKKNAR